MKRQIAALVLALFLPAHALARDGPKVVVSIKPIHALAAAVMAGVAEPKLLVRGGQSPHTYSLKPSDARALAHADLVFWVGPSVESFLMRPLEMLGPSVRIVKLIEEPRLTRYRIRRLDWLGKPAAIAGDGLDEERVERLDGHIWLDPMNAVVIVERMRAELAAIDPAHAAAYTQNATMTMARLEALDKALATRLAPLKTTPFVVFHDAYQYFEKRYGLANTGALAINPDLQPSARRLVVLREKLVAEGVVCAFAEPQFEPKLMTTLIEDTPVRRGTLDPEGAGLEPGTELYFTLLDNLAGSLERCLQASASAAP